MLCFHAHGWPHRKTVHMVHMVSRYANFQSFGEGYCNVYVFLKVQMMRWYRLTYRDYS